MGFAQTDIGFNYKALVTENGNAVANAKISVKATIKDGSSVKWQETHSNVQTDANGIFSIVIGEGTRVAGASSFDEVSWDSNNMNLTVEVDAGSGYQTMVNDEPFKYVPYAKQAESLHPGYYDLVVNNSSSNGGHGLIVHNTGNGDHQEGLTLNNGNINWSVYMNSNSDFSIHNSNIGNDPMTISYTDNSVTFLGQLNLSEDGFRISSGANNYIVKKVSDGLAFKYNSATAMKLQGSVYVEIPGKLIGAHSGNNDLKPIAYGTISSGATIVEGTENFTVEHTSTGVYKIVFNDYTDLYSSNTFVMATPGSGAGAAFIRAYSMNSSGILANKEFNFVIYKNKPMKHILTFIAFLTLTLGFSHTALQKSSLSTGGGSASSGNLYMVYAIGEVAVQENIR